MSHNPYFTGNSFAITRHKIVRTLLSCHNPYFTGNSFAMDYSSQINQYEMVTILILLETPLQCHSNTQSMRKRLSHNPYFTGNSFAIKDGVFITRGQCGHNPYFTGNSFAIEPRIWLYAPNNRHNPYFTGNSFAMNEGLTFILGIEESQSLFYWKLLCNTKIMDYSFMRKSVTILILLETPLQSSFG